MKTKILLLLILTAKIVHAQDTIAMAKPDSIRYLNPNRLEVFYWIKQKKQVFAITPLSKRIEEVNGLALGFGHIDNKLVKKQTVNGLNIEANPAPIPATFLAFMTIMYLPDIIKNHNKHPEKREQRAVNSYIIEDWDHNPYLKINGLNISTGCFFTKTSMNGLNISFANKFKNFNGLSITALGLMADRQCGISVGFLNATNDLNGIAIGAYNQSYKLDGLQIGLINRSLNNHGLQIGIYNKSNSRGFQIGVWNKNGKRSFPILNW